MRCQKYNILFLTIAKLLQDLFFLLYSVCYKVNKCRLIQKKRVLSLNRLQLDILLYKEKNQNQNAIKYVCANDIRARNNTILIVETKLNVFEAKRLAIELCQLIRALLIEKAII